MENQNDEKSNKFFAIMAGIIVGSVSWLLMVMVVARISFPPAPNLDDYLLMLSYPISAFIAGLVSYYIKKNYLLAFFTVALSILINIFLTLLIFAMAGGGFR